MSTPHPLYDAKLSELNIAVFDLETTGLYASRDAIIQVSVVHVNAVSIGDDWMTLVDPGDDHRPIPEFIEDFTGIKDAQLDGELRVVAELLVECT